MFYFKLTFAGLLAVSIFGLVTCTEETTTNNKQLSFNKDSEALNATLQVQKTNVTNSRTGRTLVPLSRTAPAFTLRRRQPIQMRARADYLPLRAQLRRVHSSPPSGQQQQTIRVGYESLKNSKFLPHIKSTNLPFANNVMKGLSKWPQLLGGHPNALSQQYMHNFKASPSFNGQIKVHPIGQAQKQAPPAAQKDNTYPKYIKPQQPAAPAPAVLVQQTQPLKQQQQQQQLQNPPMAKYTDFMQYPIPDQEKLKHHNEMHEKYLQQQQFLTPKNPIAYYQMQHSQQQHQEPLPAAQPQQSYAVQQPLQYLPQAQQQPTIPIHGSAQAHHKNTNKIAALSSAASAPPKMYSVYEENDMTELQTNNYQTDAYHILDKEAQEYLRFMNSDEYFLPKKEPNYKKLDDETDQRQLNVLKGQSQQHLLARPSSQVQLPQQQQQQHQKAYVSQAYTPSASAQAPQYTNRVHVDKKDASIYNQDKSSSGLFYQQQHPSASGSASAPASSTVLRTSYQTGYNQNQFVVNSQDGKIGKYTIPHEPRTTTKTQVATQAPLVAYPQLRHNKAGNRTPEPLRFEFTERDAMVGSYSSYTNAPQAQIRSKEFLSHNVTPHAAHVENSTLNYPNRKHQDIKPSTEQGKDDPEEGDDIQQTINNLFNHQQVIGGSDSKVNKMTSITEAPPSGQQDTEDYCERICAIVEDDNEEIVCGSDGYMYTSEAQMECYASCLHIDVTIQGKGSCSAR